MSEKNRKSSDLVLKIVLLILVIIILCFIVVIVLNSVRNNNLALDCLNKSDSEEVMSCLGDKSYSYYEKGDCGKALEVYDDVPSDLFDRQWLRALYNEAYSASLYCDESLQSYWSNKYSELMNQVEARD